MCMSVYVNESICTYVSSATGMCACIFVDAYILYMATCGDLYKYKSTYASSATGMCGHRNWNVRPSQLECAGSATGI